MKVLCFAAVFLLAFVYKADCAVTAWTLPSITGADGNAAIATTIDEHDAEGNTAITVVATGGTSYALVPGSQSPATPGTFAVASDGTVSFTGTLNYEEAASYELQIVATAADAATGTATVTIAIADENDVPTFAQVEYGVCVPNGAATGTTVLASLTATDEDVGETITGYTLENAIGGGAPTDFTYANGVLTVVNTLDRSTLEGYTLTLEAADDNGTPGTGTAAIHIVVSDSSDAVALMSGMVVTTIAFLVAKVL